MREILQQSDSLAKFFYENKVYDLASKQAEITLAMDPLNPGIIFNAGRCHYHNGNYEKAIDYMNTVLMFDPHNESAKREVSLYYSWIGNHEKSNEILKSLPQDDRTKFNLGWYELMKGNIKKGFELIESGRNIKCWGSDPQAPIEKWTGELITGKRLLVLSEGGNGDEIVFLRFLLSLVKSGIAITFKPSKAMYPVFKRINELHVVDEIKDYDCFDCWAPLMSLPYLMKIDNVNGEPYLKVNPEYVKKWEQTINGDYKVGIRWQGGRLYEYHQRRTLPVEDLLSSVQGCGELYSLQKDSDEPCPDGVIDLESQLETWEDTIAVISLLDIVITSCTAIAHIAGALGKKTIVIVPVLSYFTWAIPGSKTDWYDSVHIIRQTNPENWNEPLDKLKKYLDLIGDTKNENS
jgi:tetratricopeptide (TPR) repeat protein